MYFSIIVQEEYNCYNYTSSILRSDYFMYCFEITKTSGKETLNNGHKL